MNKGTGVPSLAVVWALPGSLLQGASSVFSPQQGITAFFAPKQGITAVSSFSSSGEVVDLSLWHLLKILEGEANSCLLVALLSILCFLPSGLLRVFVLKSLGPKARSQSYPPKEKGDEGVGGGMVSAC